MNATFDPRIWELRDREVHDNIPLMVIVIVCLFLGVVGNGFSLAFFGFKQAHSVTDFLISVLAAADLLACVVYYDEIVVLFYSFVTTNVIGCKIIFVVNNWVTIMSVSFLALIAIDRHRRICLPLKAQMSPRIARLVAASLAIFMLLFTLREAFLAEIVTKQVAMNDNSSVAIYVCSHTPDKKKAVYVKATLILFIATYVLLFAIIIFAYILVCRQIRRMSLNKKIRTKAMRFKDDAVFDTREEMSDTGVSSSSCESTKTTDTVCDKHAENTVQVDNNMAVTLVENDIDHTARDTKAIAHTREAQKEVVHSENDIQVTIVEGDAATCVHTEHSIGSTLVKTVSDVDKENVNSPAKIQEKDNIDEAEKRITKMIVTFTAVSLLSFVPYFVANLALPRHVSTEENLHNMNKKIARQFYMLNSIVNPYVICFFHPKFRSFMKSCFIRNSRKKPTST